MQHQHRGGIACPIVNIVHPETGLYVEIVWCKRVVRKAREAGFIGSQNTHAIDCPD